MDRAVKADLDRVVGRIRSDLPCGGIMARCFSWPVCSDKSAGNYDCSCGSGGVVAEWSKEGEIVCE